MKLEVLDPKKLQAHYERWEKIPRNSGKPIQDYLQERLDYAKKLNQNKPCPMERTLDGVLVPKDSPEAKNATVREYVFSGLGFE